jgi:hypothetical protein
MCIRNVIERFLTCFSGLSTSRRSHTMTSLLGMPLELLVQISTYVTTPDLSALRLTCKRLERSLWEWFADEFFAKKQFMITHPSLQALVDISHHPSLSKKLRHVIISTHVYDHFNGPLPAKDAKACDMSVFYSAAAPSSLFRPNHRDHRSVLSFSSFTVTCDLLWIRSPS